ncbi:single-stranded-DNA-specific exonuclease RecJ, partial [Pelagibacterales bacterium SAG-MED13]|nr:single-stranded-DNA-specific exonuclease RecJ [Pelagibacterales bacterium SAG-MED13]
MISVSGKKWKEKKVDKNLTEKVQQDYKFSKILSQLIVTRNFDENEIHLIKNDLVLTNVFINNIDFIESSKLLEKTIKNNENICILGDYDVDGSAAASLLSKFFEYLNQPYFCYIPDRENDGYGASVNLFKKLILKKPKLVIMVDCGSTSTKAIEYLNENNIKSIVIDHHEINKPYPKANIIINPKKNNGYLEFDYLCATALTYFFLEILAIKLRSKINLKKYLIYVLLATVCDVMPLRKLNRNIAKNALKDFNLNDNLVFKKIYQLYEKKNKINVDDLGFLFGPILNSGGRLGKSNYAVKLLTSDNSATVDKLTNELINLNNKRKKIETIILDNIDYKKITDEDSDLIIHYDPSINEGLIGIIASRLKDLYNKPSIVITNSNHILKGSARSIHDYNIGRVVKKLLDMDIIINGGGHNMAAGFTLQEKNLRLFKNVILKDFSKHKHNIDYSFSYDAILSSMGFNKNLLYDINKIGPFGTGNVLPIFLFKELKVIKLRIIDKKHISCILKSKKGISINSICFNSLN